MSHKVVSIEEASFSQICGIALSAEPWDAPGAAVSKNLVRGDAVYRNLLPGDTRWLSAHLDRRPSGSLNAGLL